MSACHDQKKNKRECSDSTITKHSKVPVQYVVPISQVPGNMVILPSTHSIDRKRRLLRTRTNN